MKTLKRFVPIALAAWLTLLTVNSLVPSLFADTASAATNAINCITVGAGLKPAGQHCADFTLKVNFSPSGGTNGTSAAVARGDHNHDNSYWKLGGNGGTNPTTNFLGTTDGQPLILQGNSVGKVGIGTTTPYTKFQVVGGGVSTDSFFAFSHVQSTAPPYGVYLNAPRNDTLGLFTRSLERLTVDGSGNVGIGTTNPQSKLQVVGNYIQFPIRTDVPPATDCDSANEQGRVIVGNPNFVDQRVVVYVCTRAGWAGVTGAWPTH